MGLTCLTFWPCCNFLVCADLWELWLTPDMARELTIGVCFPPKINHSAPTLGSSNNGFWHVKIYPEPPWATSTVVLLFRSGLPLYRLLSYFFPLTACLIPQPDLIKTVKDLSHSDSTLLWVAFTNIFVFRDTICRHARKGMLLLFPGTPAHRSGLPAWWALWQKPRCMLINLPAQLLCRKDRQTGLY